MHIKANISDLSAIQAARIVKLLQLLKRQSMDSQSSNGYSDNTTIKKEDIDEDLEFDDIESLRSPSSSVIRNDDLSIEVLIEDFLSVIARGANQLDRDSCVELLSSPM